jgi:hypothetical protein
LADHHPQAKAKRSRDATISSAQVASLQPGAFSNDLQCFFSQIKISRNSHAIPSKPSNVSQNIGNSMNIEDPNDPETTKKCQLSSRWFSSPVS